MAMEIKILVDGNRIVVDAPQKEYHHEFKNTLATIPNGMVIALGQSLDDLIKENPHNENKFRDEVTVVPLYTASAIGLDNLTLLLEYQVRLLRNRMGFFSRILSCNVVLCHLELPDYEKIDERAQRQFEFSAIRFVVRDLTINNEAKGWEKWQRYVLEISRFVFLLIGTFLWYLFVVSIAQLMLNLGMGRWVIYLLGLFAIYYFVVLLRVLFLRSFLPHDLLRSEMLSPRIGLGKFGIFLVKNFFRNN